MNNYLLSYRFSGRTPLAQIQADITKLLAAGESREAAIKKLCKLRRLTTRQATGLVRKFAP